MVRINSFKVLKFLDFQGGKNIQYTLRIYMLYSINIYKKKKTWWDFRHAVGALVHKLWLEEKCMVAIL